MIRSSKTRGALDMWCIGRLTLTLTFDIIFIGVRGIVMNYPGVPNLVILV